MSTVSRDSFSRRAFLARTAGLAALGLAGRQAWARASATLSSPAVTVYKSPSCGCCAKWVDHLTASGFETLVHDESDMDPIKDRLGVPAELRSCHTALAGGYLIEGHVPAEDLARLLHQRPEVMGLAVPGMPSGTPGMAAPGAPHEPYQTLAFQRDGSTRLFARHP